MATIKNPDKLIIDEIIRTIKRALKSNLTKDQLKKIKSTIGKIPVKSMRDKLKKEFKKIYLNEVLRIEKELKLDIGFGTPDRNVLEVLSRNRKLLGALTSIKDVAGKKAFELVSQGLEKGKSLEEIKNKLKKVFNIVENRAEVIARVETQKIQTLARENSYRKALGGNLRFKWIGPDDKRTTKICRAIVKRTKKGVSERELKEIIQEEADPNFYNPAFPYSPHFNCRHVQVRVVRLK